MKHTLGVLLTLLVLAGCSPSEEAYQGGHFTEDCMKKYSEWVNQERCKVDQRDGG